MFRRNHRDHDQDRDNFDKVNVYVCSVVCGFYYGPAMKFKKFAGIFTMPVLLIVC
jgi:hypothetical protein